MIYLVIKSMTPLLLAATGGLVSEIAGTLNIGLEGLILAGAFSALVGASLTGSFWFGVLLAVIVGMLLGALFVVFGHRMRANIFITGLAVNLLVVGVTAFLSNILFDTQGILRPMQAFLVPSIGKQIVEVSDLRGVIMGQSLFVPLSWAMVSVVGIILRRSSFGLHLVATGLSRETMRLRGGNPDFYQAVAIVFSGVAGALAGAVLSLELGAYVPNMSAGRGWIALVVVLLARRRVWGVVIAALLFSIAEYGANAIQGTAEMPRTIALAVPYVLTLVSMILFAVVTRAQKKLRSR